MERKCAKVAGLIVCSCKFNANMSLYKDYLFDPGIQCSMPLKDVKAVFLTHGHMDHSSGATTFSGKARIYAPRYCIAFVENPQILHTITVGGGAVPEDLITPYFIGPSVNVDIIIVEGRVAEGVYALATPGHTPGHHSYIVETGYGKVLIAGDLLFSNDYLEKYPLLYHMDTIALLESLKKIKIADIDAVVPGHGTPVEGSRAVNAIIEENIRTVNNMLKFVEEILPDTQEEALSFDEVIAEVARKLELSKSPRTYSVLSPTIRALLFSLLKLGRATLAVVDGVLRWYATKT
ncbi:MAG TPA: MBL fold metallo-hydrolase [Pyrodictiaceae archaeon]|nr:MBL fold metallo-hydrolase [Pyrodictiaceae archaeon]HIQ55570.1 MBL fold metallo-hydrolase [Pyrodictium sp.]